MVGRYSSLEGLKKVYGSVSIEHQRKVFLEEDLVTEVVTVREACFKEVCCSVHECHPVCLPSVLGINRGGCHSCSRWMWIMVVYKSNSIWLRIHFLPIEPVGCATYSTC